MTMTEIENSLVECLECGEMVEAERIKKCQDAYPHPCCDKCREEMKDGRPE